MKCARRLFAEQDSEDVLESSSGHNWEPVALHDSQTGETPSSSHQKLSTTYKGIHRMFYLCIVFC